MPSGQLNPVSFLRKPFFRRLGLASLSLVAVTVLSTLNSASAQVELGLQTRALITQNIDEGKLVRLKGNTRPEANAGNDRGPVADDLPMEHMLLQLRRTPEQEKAVEEFINQLHTAGSPNFHQWITAQEFGTKFGLAKQDLDTITGWLSSHGFTVDVVYRSGMVIDFSGTAGQVRTAFHTEVHTLEVAGEKHIANMSDPWIPAALVAAVSGVVSFHDFRPHTMHKMRGPGPNYTFGSGTYAVVPADLATIYNLNPLLNAGTSGQGQTIVLIEDTDVFSTSDWSTFRSTFGLSNYTSGSFTTVHPAPSSGTNNCSDPGVVGTKTNPVDAEAILDAEWASAAAPNAEIQIASCSDTSTTFGGLIAVENLINATGPPPAIMSISYGQCETQNGAAANAAYNAAYQQAVTEGVSVFVAAGDSGAAGCNNSATQATFGISVNAFASTAYNVAVGGTDFSDTYSGTNSTYWNASNASTYGSAISYIPEIPWNNSCASALIAGFEGYSTTYGASGFCSSLVGSLFQTTVAGGGGPSGCATGTPSTKGVVSGTCQGWPKPAWQSVLGNPSDGVRDTPDISLFAADGQWGHYYVFCWSDTANGGAACTGAPSGWSGAGGTSFAAPIMAGIQALINQKTGARQGNPNPVYYQLAAAEYGSSGSSSCNSSKGNAVSSSCVFYDVTLGDMDVNCTGTHNCYLPSGTQGVLSTSNSSYSPAYGTTTGWDFATGIGTLNAANLVNNWPSSLPDFSLSASPTSVSITRGTSSGPTTITVTPRNGFNGSVGLSASGLPNGVTASFNPPSTTTTSTLTLTANATATTGTVNITVTGISGSLNHTTQISLQSLASTTTGLSSSANPSIYEQFITLMANVSPSAATGAVQFFDGSTSLGTANLSGGQTSLSTSGLSVGSHSITAQYGGDSNFAASTSPVLTQTVNTSTGWAVRVNAGGPSYVDSHGQTWQADTGYNGGATFSTTAAISGTSDPPLFQSERYDNGSGAPLQYSFSVPNGTYAVNLYFAEIYSGCFSVGCRVFNVLVQGTTAFSNLDVFAQAGANAALVKSTMASVTNGTLSISFGRITQNPTISAIEILQATVAPTGTISGTVTNAANNTAISGATVSYSGGSTTTNSSGAYTLANVPTGTYTVTTSATGFQSSSQPNVSVTNGTTTTTNFSLTANSVVRVNAGGPAYVDSHGQTWQADMGFNGGATFSTAAAIAGTADPTLLQTERYGATVQYSFSVPNGTYALNLYFAEIYNGCFRVGCRVFNVLVQGTTAFSNLDIFAQVGANAALVKSTSASVTNGTLTISFGNITENPTISAIEILPTSSLGTISGTVTNAANNTAISGATVSYSGGSTTTNSGGAYTLANVSPGTYTVTASATGFQSSSQPNVTVTSGTTTTTNFSLATSLTVVRVNAGGPAYVDSHGQTWQADTGFNGGATFSTTSAISGTADPSLLQTERYGTSLQYSFSVPNGTYTVNVYFAEIWSGCFSVGCRVFNVLVQGTTAFPNLDVFAQAGANAALEKSTTTSVTNGTLTISFGSVTQSPTISAIEVLQK